MSEKYRNGRPVHNEDNENTRTTVIPPEARQQYNERYRQPYQQPQEQPYRQPYRQQPQQEQYYQQPYQQQPQQEQPYRQPYQQQQQEQYYQQPYQQPAPPPQMRRPAPKPKKVKKKKKRSGTFIGRLFKRLFTFVMTVVLMLFIMYSCTSLSLIRKLDYVPTQDRERTSGAMSRSYVTSVLLIGTDGRSLDERGRSDTMMLVSANSATNKVCTTSFMRDCYVEIPGYGWDKLNAAYSYGGPELLMDTIEHNFGVKIDDYVCINFLSFASIVDSVGGIDVDLSDAEADEINTILQAEVNEIMGDERTSDLLKSGGSKVHLVGKQALAYARIRHIGNADFERTERQRRVVDLVMDKLKTFNPMMLKNLSTKVLPDVTTNMDTAKLYIMSLRAPLWMRYERSPMQVPAEGTYYGESTASGDALIVDFDQNFETIKNNVFANE